MRLAILGGSSPFTLGFFMALRQRPLSEIREIILFGRDTVTMANIAHFARAALPGVRITTTNDPSAAIVSVDIIIHQIRYGGLDGRMADEQLACARGSIPDETMGPGALSAGIRLMRPFMRLAQYIAAHAPHAHFINLTNPLGLSTSLARLFGIANPIGICELPVHTAWLAAQALGQPPNALDWHYSGLNHRGFIHHIRKGSQDLLPALANSGHEFGGLSGEALLEFGAVPTKYFSLFSQGRPVSRPGRAAQLQALRNMIAQELASSPAQLPPSLNKREQPWWAMSVIPLLHALASPWGQDQLLNLAGDDGVTREGWCNVSNRGAIWRGSRPGPANVEHWMEHFIVHETACLGAILDPTPAKVQRALLLDPLHRNQKNNRSCQSAMPEFPRQHPPHSCA